MTVVEESLCSQVSSDGGVHLKDLRPTAEPKIIEFACKMIVLLTVSFPFSNFRSVLPVKLGCFWRSFLNLNGYIYSNTQMRGTSLYL